MIRHTVTVINKPPLKMKHSQLPLTTTVTFALCPDPKELLATHL